ncbi:carboxypeptidase-like regulatory domain-containing protein [Sphingobacterium sp. SG20118]|uniref:carboxypeptidase-like regulatory domain-containing protein n=1 Tax=Sphingobacterium sp. SG20118 TaxID=3367156 RepID=UPI0037DFC6E9
MIKTHVKSYCFQNSKLNLIFGIASTMSLLLSPTMALSNSVKKNNISANSVFQTQQQVEIKGTVTDKDTPLTGVNIRVKGTMTTIGITDPNGRFTVKTNADAILELTYVGYKTVELSVEGNRQFQVSMEKSEILDEVVVVGFGKQKKKTLTGAISVVGSEVFEGRPVQNATMALQGTVPGLNISKGEGTMDIAPSINIRGMATIGDGFQWRSFNFD